MNTIIAREPIVEVIRGKEYIGGRAVTRFECNGCGSRYTRWILDTLPYLPMREICCSHDFAYWCGGSEDERKDADDFFKKGILSFQDGHCALARWYIRRVAGARWFMVRCFGWYGSFVYTRSGEPRKPFYSGGFAYFFDDEVLSNA